LKKKLKKIQNAQFFLDQNRLISNPPANRNASVEESIASKLNELIDHFKADDPVGLPIPIPDPFEIPDVSTKLPIGSISMRDIKAAGVSKFRLKEVSVELDEKMEASVELSFDELVITGNYTLKTFGTSRGIHNNHYVRSCFH
jgi:Haemolymph juvenile hormone binding protein (JHBP)